MSSSCLDFEEQMREVVEMRYSDPIPLATVKITKWF